MRKPILLLIVALFVCGCETIGYREALELSNKGEFEKAYSTIKAAYDKNPEDEQIKTSLENIKKALIEKYLDESNAIVSYNLREKRLFLQKALDLDTTQKNISSQITEIDKEIDSINRQVRNALHEKDVLECFKKFIVFNNYEPYFDDVKHLKDKILTNEISLVGRLEELSRKDEDNKVLPLFLAAKKVFPNNQKFKIGTEQIFSKKAAAAFNIAKDYAKVGGSKRLATSLVYLLIAWDYDQKLPHLVEDIKEKFIKLQKKIVPNLIIEFSKSFSDKQKSETLSFLESHKETDKIRNLKEKDHSYRPQNNDIVVTLNLNDLSVDVNPTQSLQYSKFRSGYQSIPNPQYEQLRFQYEQAVANARNAQYNYAYNPNWGTAFAKGLAEGAVNVIAGQIARTPIYIQEPVYQDYQYGKIDLNVVLNIKVKYKLIDPLSKSTLKDGVFENKDEKTEVTITGAHPDDAYGIINTNATDPKEILNNFCNENFNNLAKMIIDDLVGKKVVIEAELAFKRKNYGEVVDRVFEFKLLKWFSGPGLKEAELTDNEIWDICSDMNIIKIQDVLKKYSLDDYLKLDLSINNIFRSSFINNIFLSEEFSRFTEAFEQFNPEKFEYREDYGLILGNFITNLFKKDAVEEKKEILQKPTSNIIDQSLSSVVVIETPLCSGSGFIINNKGYIITNYHVIENQDNITVKLNNGEKVFANVISLAKSKDLALLKIAVGSIKPIRVGNIKRVRTGDTVYALGAPGGWGDQILEQSVTKGIVSSIRYLEAPYNPLEKIQFIQTDAAINPGNSGGPLINEKGEAIGINNQKIVTRGVEGIGFAISIEEVKKSFSEYLR